MKKLLSLCTLLLAFYISNAQQEFVIDTVLPTNLCLTPQIAPHFNQLEQMKLTTTPYVYPRIKVHVLQKEQEPKGGQTIEGVNIMLNNLYNIFDDEGIYFNWDGDINYINSDYYYNMSSSQKADELINNYNSSDAIDLFLADDTNSFVQYTQGVGVSSAIVFGGYLMGEINGKEGFTTTTRSGFIGHLMGHVLNLWDTHYGSPFIGTGGCAENTFGTNGSTCGDYINDTPADPGLYIGPYGFNVDITNCTYDPQYFPVNPPQGPQGGYYQPDTHNYMSFTYFSCMDNFTYGQSKVMKGAILFIEDYQDINVEDYLYVRADTDCFVCNIKDFDVYTNLDISNLSVTSTNNILAEIIPDTNVHFKIKVTNLIGTSNEGASASFQVNYSPNGIDQEPVATQPVWVGKPQSLPDDLLYGTGDGGFPINPEDNAYHVLGDLQYRFGGFEYNGWDYPEPNIEWEGSSSSSVWQYKDFNKFFNIENSNTGSITGWVRAYGINPCGEGDFGNNRICVKNSGDGVTECDPEPQPIFYYPNPANSLLEIDLSLQDYKIFDVYIYDEYQTVRYYDQSTNVVKTVDTFNLTNGTYYLHIYDGSEVILSAILIINH